MGRGRSKLNCRLGRFTLTGHLPMVGCSRGTALELTQVQVEGKRRMSAQDFVNGYRLFEGEPLGQANQES
jgi:methionyl-tRNA formyltransferase